jgi:hypothetical protein
MVPAGSYVMDEAQDSKVYKGLDCAGVPEKLGVDAEQTWPRLALLATDIHAALLQGGRSQVGAAQDNFIDEIMELLPPVRSPNG